jgi:hypothetical protein
MSQQAVHEEVLQAMLEGRTLREVISPYDEK